MSFRKEPLKAVQLLILATALWGVSFPTMRALALAQKDLPGGNGDSWFFSSLCVVYRFGIAALIMLPLCARTLRGLTRAELEQGIVLGLFGGAGILLQTDGLAHTHASTSAFLTQIYCVLVPLWVAFRTRRWPATKIFLGCGLVLAGVAILAGVDWRELRLGRGELETIASSVLFTGQILWLERPRYAANNVNHFTLVMFVVITLMAVPVAVANTGHPGQWLDAYRSGGTLGLMAILVLICTMGAYRLMNFWQRHISATQAGLIYCVEPVFASAFALFLPGWYSVWAGIQYPNELMTASLLAGGALITIANLLVQWPGRERTSGAATASSVNDDPVNGPSLIR